MNCLTFALLSAVFVVYYVNCVLFHILDMSRLSFISYIGHVKIKFYFIYFITENVHLAMTAWPDKILPVLTKQLKVVCSVRNDMYQAAVKNSLQYFLSPNQSLWNDTMTLIDTYTSKSSKSQTEADFSRLLSLVITRTNKDTGLNDTIASVTGCDSPVIEAPFVGEVQVVGSTEGSPLDGEQGYISVTWDRPQERSAGVFSCEAYAQNPAKHPVSLTAYLEINSVQPQISDLVSYISTNEKSISELKSKVSDLYYENRQLKQQALDLATENEFIESRLDQSKCQNVQSGTSGCGYQTVYFSPAFNSTPKVFTSLNSLSFNSYYSSWSFSYSNNIQSITNESFVTSCSISAGQASLDWFAFDC
ncbi:hypothetical protein Btru_047610 [Bulinus truncatus]|nr:hypothetical protein Btru_047610 [Bulinus truncatus]